MVEAEQRLTTLVSDLQTVALAQDMDDALIDELDGVADKSAGDARKALWALRTPLAAAMGDAFPGALEDTFSKATAAHAALVAVRTRYDAVRQAAPRYDGLTPVVDSEQVKVRYFVTRVHAQLGDTDSMFLSPKAVESFATSVLPRLAQETLPEQESRSYYQTVYLRFNDPDAFDSKDRHMLEHFALYLTKSHPKNLTFHFASLWERAPLALVPVLRATSAALWQAVARIVIHVEALEEQRTHPDVHIEQLLAYMTPYRYAGDQPLPKGIHDGTWFPTSRRMPLTAAAGADVPPPDARAGAPARAATPPVTPRRRCRHCDGIGHEAAECPTDRRVTGAEKKARARAAGTPPAGKKIGPEPRRRR